MAMFNLGDLDLLGADFIGAGPASRAAVSGQRAVDAAAKLKRMPRLAAAVAKAGQKALAAAGAAAPPAKSQAQAPTAPKAAGAAPKPGAAPRPAPAPPARTATAPRPTPSKRPPPARTRVGEEADASADVYASLADAAVRAADFVAGFQDLIAQLPPAIPLVPQGQKILSDFELLFGAPLEKGLSGEKAVGPATQGLIGSLQYLLDLQSESPPVGPWVWFARANAYLKLHPAAPADSAASGDGAVAKVVVSPATITVTPGMPQAFSATVTDAAGNPVNPKAPLTWSVLPTGTATIDKDGNLTAQVQGALTVTATADGVSGTAAANSVAGQPLPPGGGGGDSGSGGGGGGGGGGSPLPPSPGGYSPPGDDYEPPPEDEGFYEEAPPEEDTGTYDEGAVEEDQGEDPMDDSMLGGRGGRGGGPRGGGPRGGGPRGPRGGGGRRGGRGWRGGYGYGPVVYEVPVYSEGIELDEILLDPATRLPRAMVVGGDLDMLDAEMVGVDASLVTSGFGTALQAAGVLAQTGLNIYDKDQQDKKTSADEAKKLQAAIRADQQAADALARAELSAQVAAGAPNDKGKAAQAAADATTAQTMASMQDAAGRGLSSSASSDRLQAAQDALQAATKVSGAPGVAKVNAWNKTINRISNAQIVSSAPSGKESSSSHDSGESWWDKLLHFLHLK